MGLTERGLLFCVHSFFVLQSFRSSTSFRSKPRRRKKREGSPVRFKFQDCTTTFLAAGAVLLIRCCVPIRVLAIPPFRHCQEVRSNMRCSSASSSPIFTSRDYSKGPLYLISPKFVKLGRFAGKERLVLPMNCASSSSSSYHGIEYSSEMLQQQIEGDKDAVMIVDHGSRREESNLMLNEFVKMFKARTSYQIVEPAHMELAEPTIMDAFTKCVQHGATRVIVSPFFLFPGRHWHKDIPSLVAEASKEHKGVFYVITAPLGSHELMVDVMSDRIKHCVSHVAGIADECDVCVGTRTCRLYP